MIEIKTEWTEENLKRYMMYKFFFSNKFTMLSTVVFGLCFAVISVSCAVMFAMTESAVFLVLVGAVVVLAGGAAAFFVPLTKIRLCRKGKALSLMRIK